MLKYLHEWYFVSKYRFLLIPLARKFLSLINIITRRRKFQYDCRQFCDQSRWRSKSFAGSTQQGMLPVLLSEVR